LYTLISTEGAVLRNMLPSLLTAGAAESNWIEPNEAT
jgi:hypothetical protein